MKASAMELVDSQGASRKGLRQGFRCKTLETGTFHRSLGKGKCSAVWMVRLRVDVQTDTGIVWPSLVCSQHVVCSMHAASVKDLALAMPSRVECSYGHDFGYVGLKTQE